ncbi:MAG: hypothetical protein ACYDEJ_03135 [Desulfitobacteriaceae bacterium]
MSERLGVKQVCGCANNFGGELWDGSYPALVYTFLRRKNDSSPGYNELWLEAENVYTVYYNNAELARIQTTKGHAHAYKQLLKKIRSKHP